MKVEAIKVQDVDSKRKYLITCEGQPVILCGKRKKDMIVSVICTGKISEDIPISKSKQGKILKRVTEIKNTYRPVKSREEIIKLLDDLNYEGAVTKEGLSTNSKHESETELYAINCCINILKCILCEDTSSKEKGDIKNV